MTIRMLHWACRIILAAVFIYSGYVKILQPLQFAADISSYQLFPDALIIPIMNYLPWFEVALGLGILIGWKLRFFAFLAVGLLAMFMTALIITLARGIDANCGCFGTGDPISALTIARDTSFIVPALFLLFENRIRVRLQRKTALEGGADIPPAAV